MSVLDCYQLVETYAHWLITHDVDFGTLAINEGVSFYGIIYLRLKNVKVSNVKNMRQFYLTFPIGDALRSQWSWTHLPVADAG